MSVTCPYCGEAAQLVGGDVIYPHRPDLYALKFWHCQPCDAWTGTHANSREHKPKGRLANAELRRARIDAHAAFDPLWKSGRMKRTDAYEWLRERLGLERTPHIGFMDADGCRRVVAACHTSSGGNSNG
jgi:hypothetical protein